MLPTLVVAATVATMVALGVWQLQRAAWKKDLLARYAHAQQLAPVAWPSIPFEPQDYYFRRADGFCLEVAGWRTTAGRSQADEPGWAHIAQCRTGAEGPGMQVDIGWSRSSDPPVWRGGAVSGIVAPDRKHGIRLVAAKPAPGLQPSQPPSPASIPDNHLLYAIQWFAFALAAVVIYLLALRRRGAQVAVPPTSG